MTTKSIGQPKVDFYTFQKIIKKKRITKKDFGIASNWASEASPTLGCSIEISRGMSVGMYVCLSWSKKRRRKYVGQTRACSKSVLGGKIRPVTPALLKVLYHTLGYCSVFY